MKETPKDTMLRHLQELTEEMNIPSEVIRLEEKIIDDLVNYKKVKNVWS